MQTDAERLVALRRVDTPAADRQRARILAACARRPPQDAPALLALHDAALFLCAYPSSVAVQRCATRVLAQCVRRAARLQLPLENSGLADTHVALCPSLDLAAWLLARHAQRVELDWRDPQSTAALEALLGRLLDVEVDGFRDDARGTPDWLRLRSGTRGAPALATLLSILQQSDGRAALLDACFEPLGLRVRWRLQRRGASRTWLRFPPRRAPECGLIARSAELAELLERDFPRPTALSRRARRELTDAARATLAVRGSETDAITYANEQDVTLFQLERGLDIALLGMQPERRLPIESYIGYVVARNGVPVAYGGGWLFCGRCEIGVNIFPEFRGGESSLIFAQVLRTYAQHFGVRQFLVEPFQFGQENPDAIRSGAFWMYYRLGFRPTSGPLRRLEEREAQRIAADAAYRSPPATLRRLATAPLYLDVPGARRSATRGYQPIAPDLASLGLAVTRCIGKRFNGDRARATRWANALLRRVCDVPRGVVADSARAAPFPPLALVVAQIPGLARWTRAERRALGAVLLAKTGPVERDFVVALARHTRLIAEWRKL